MEILCEYHVPHEVTSETTFKLEATWGDGSLPAADDVAAATLTFAHEQEPALCFLMLDVNVTNPLAACHLDAALLRSGHVMEQAVKGRSRGILIISCYLETVPVGFLHMRYHGTRVERVIGEVG